MEINISEHYILYYFDPLMREFRSKAQQYGGEHILLYKKEISSIPPNSLVILPLRLDPHKPPLTEIPGLVY